MTTRQLCDDTSSFRIRRSIVGRDGIGSGVDENVKRQLDELDALLGKRLVFSGANGSNGLGAGAAVSAAKAANKRKTKRSSSTQAALHFFDRPLTPKHIPATAGHATSWDDTSLAGYLAAHDGKSGHTLAEHIDRTPELAQLKDAFLVALQQSRSQIGADNRAVLDSHPNITDYLIAHAYHKLQIRDEDVLRRFILNNHGGSRLFADYAAVSAARFVIDQEQLKVTHYNVDGSQFVKRLTEKPIALSSLSFDKSVRDVIRKFVFDRDEENVIRAAKIFPSLPADMLEPLIRYLQRTTLQITATNVDTYLPGIVLQIMKQRGVSEAEVSDETPDEDFRIQFQDDADGTTEIDKSAVLCAGQLYHGMVLGEELDVFGAVHYLAHRRMNTFGGMRIEDPILRDDLQRYVFDNRYVDLGAKKSRPVNGGVDKYRTRPAERQMFHRQVFDEGYAEMPEDMLVNGEFKRLWKVLMLESARYLDRAQASLNPESFVSRQNVMQAVEDLQYNLSTSCTGMATVISPAVDAELNFVLERILKHAEILKQVVPEGGTWKRCVDKLNGERRKSVGPAQTLYNKATLGQGIIEMIANYSPAPFEGDQVFSTFIGKVDAFITTQSILERGPKLALKDVEEEHDEDPHDAMPGLMPEQAKPANGVGAPTDEWDF